MSHLSFKQHLNLNSGIALLMFMTIGPFQMYLLSTNQETMHLTIDLGCCFLYYLTFKLGLIPQIRARYSFHLIKRLGQDLHELEVKPQLSDDEQVQYLVLLDLYNNEADTVQKPHWHPKWQAKITKKEP